MASDPPTFAVPPGFLGIGRREHDAAISIAGIPLDITFSEGHGCLAKVVFESLGIEADLTDGGAVVAIPALEPGVYAFSCGMHMVHGSVTAE